MKNTDDDLLLLSTSVFKLIFGFATVLDWLIDKSPLSNVIGFSFLTAVSTSQWRFLLSYFCTFYFVFMSPLFIIALGHAVLLPSFICETFY